MGAQLHSEIYTAAILRRFYSPGTDYRMVNVLDCGGKQRSGSRSQMATATAAGLEVQGFSLREIAERFQCTRHRVLVACALAGVVPRKVSAQFVIRVEDVDLLRPLLEPDPLPPMPTA